MSRDSESEAAGRRVDGYLATVARLEPGISPIAASAFAASAFYASVAISLKRIADILERLEPALRPHPGIGPDEDEVQF